MELRVASSSSEIRPVITRASLKRKAAAGLEHAKEIAKDSEAPGNVTHGVIGIDGVEGGGEERELGGCVVQTEGDERLQGFGVRQGGGGLDALGIDVGSGASATH